MNTLLGIACAIFAASAFVAARKLKGFSEGQKLGLAEGQKLGYQQGFQEGHKAADNWWMNWEHEVTRTQKSIQNEERWP